MATSPGCINPSNLWSYNVPCPTTYQPFEPKPTGGISQLECALTQMGPSRDDDQVCWEAFSNQPLDCPEEWTSAGEYSYGHNDGITHLTTFCCPKVYPFTLNTAARESVTTIDKTGYSIAIEPSWLRWVSWCGATSVGALSEKTITITVPGASVTETVWNFENDVLVAPAVPVTKYIYTYEDTTSICSGSCSPQYSNPLKPETTGPTPTPTPAPTDKYVPPPSHPTTQFTPGESCIASSMKWLVSTACNLGGPELPGWVECAITITGNPLASNRCNPYRYTTGDDQATTWYDKCPIGYNTVSSRTYRPFFSVHTFEEAATTSYSTTYFDGVDLAYACCPDRADFKYIDDGSYVTKATHPNGEEVYVSIYVPPRCVATHVEDLANQEVALTMFYNPSIPDKRKRQEEIEMSNGQLIIGTTTRNWDVDKGVIFAEPATFAYTVFHGTYTCFQSCREYFSYSYNNTDPNYTPTPLSDSHEITGNGGPTSNDALASTASGEASPTENASSASKLDSSTLLTLSIFAILLLF